jgi:tape measure domain-containing protein
VALDVGSIYADLGARFDASGFRAFDAAARSAEQRTRGLTSVMGGLGSSILQWTSRGALALGGLGVAAGALGLRFDNMKEQATVAFTTMLGSSAAAHKELRDLYNFAAHTPFTFEGVTTAATRLLAMGFHARDVKGLLRDIGDAASGLGSGTEGMNRIALALGQIQVRGHLAGGEMMQLVNNGVSASKYLTEAYGISGGQLAKLQQKGLIDAASAIKIIREGMRRDFGGLSAEQSKTFGGLWSTIRDTFNQIAGQVMQPFFNRAKRWMQELVRYTGTAEFRQHVRELQHAAEETAQALARAAGWVREHWGTIKSVAKTVAETFADVVRAAQRVYDYLSHHQNVLTAVLSVLGGIVSIYITLQAVAVAAAVASGAAWLIALGPIGIVIGVIGVLAGAFVVLYNRSETFHKAVDAGWRGLVTIVQWAWQSIQPTIDLLEKGFGRIGQAAGFVAGAAGDVGSALGLAQGGRLNKPHIIVAGEEAPVHPEYFISTNPRDRARSRGLVRQLVEGFLGGRVRYFQSGGMFGVSFPSAWGSDDGGDDFGAGGGGDWVPGTQGGMRPDPPIRRAPPLRLRAGTFGPHFPGLQDVTPAQRAIQRGNAGQIHMPGAPGPANPTMMDASPRDQRLHAQLTPAMLNALHHHHRRTGPKPLTPEQRYAALLQASSDRYQAAANELDVQAAEAEGTATHADDTRVQQRSIALQTQRLAEVRRLLVGAFPSQRPQLLAEEASLIRGIQSGRAALHAIPDSYLSPQQQYLLAEAQRRGDVGAVSRLQGIDRRRIDAARRAAVRRGDWAAAATLSQREASVTPAAPDASGYLDALRGEAAELLGSGTAFAAEYGGRRHRVRGHLAERAEGVTVHVNTLHPGSPRVMHAIRRQVAQAASGGGAAVRRRALAL